MELVLTIVHIVVSVFLIFVVLLQSAQAADLAGAFGGGGSQTALGMRGAATLLQKLTTAAAVIFMLTSLTLGIAGRSERSLIDDVDTVVPSESSEAPAQPEAPATDPGSGEASQGEGGKGKGKGS